MTPQITQINKFRTAECEHCDGTGKRFDHAAIGGVLRTMRERKGLSLRDVCRTLNLSAAYVSDLELGRRNWTLERIDRYREALSKAA